MTEEEVLSTYENVEIAYLDKMEQVSLDEEELKKLLVLYKWLYKKTKDDRARKRIFLSISFWRTYADYKNIDTPFIEISPIEVPVSFRPALLKMPGAAHYKKISVSSKNLRILM